LLSSCLVVILSAAKDPPFRLLAHNRIPSRNAAVLGYAAQLMLVSLPTYERTLKPLYDQALVLSKLALQRHKMDKEDRDVRVAIRELDLFERFAEVVQNFAAITPDQRKMFLEVVHRTATRKPKEPDAETQPEPQPVSS
jgi:hypothetical protein